jgi:His-Xaa-Ser system radical SAM maturase HxsB
VRPTFHAAEHFANRGDYKLLPFRFIDLDGQKVVVNLVGEHEILDSADFHDLVGHRLAAGSSTYQDLKAKHFLTDTDAETPIQLLATKLRTKYQFLAGFTRLHIFVVTLRCDHSCQYCQVSRVTAEKSKYDMRQDSADHALDLVFRAPAQRLKIEFQGGEPLLNFDLIRYVVEETERRNASRAEPNRKSIEFVITTNLSTISDEMLDFCRQHQIYISTSLDGPAFIHNANRPRSGNDAYELTVRGITRVREALGHDAVSALMTTTRLSLEHPEAIVDEYVAQGFDHIFLRPISPYGFALRTQRRTGYERSAFLEFYRRAFERIIEVNQSGTDLVEIYAQILLTKILTPYATGYVDLQSPAGAGIGAVVYNYDGDVYASDEARMLAEMGDKTFRLGALGANSYEEIFGGPVLRRLVAESMTDALPGCADCAFQPYCGADPIENHATRGDIVGHRPTSDFCNRNMGLIKHLMRLLHGSDAFTRDLLEAWAYGVPVNEVLQTSTV